MVGTPAENCDGTTGNLTLTVGGSRTLEDSWSIEVQELGIDFEFDALSLGGGVTTTWGQTKGIEYTQQLSVEVPPGFQVIIIIISFATL